MMKQPNQNSLSKHSSKSYELFMGRPLVIATKHQKETVISPIMKEAIGVECFPSALLDTDQLGTFTGEVNRTESPLAVARRKCEMAMDLHGCDLAIANEGSFGPHPTLCFVPADEELFVFRDRKNNIEVTHREITLETNFNGSEISTEKELRDFAEKSGFPSHGLILRDKKDGLSVIKKGITDWTTLIEEFLKIKDKFGQAFIETDMRAQFNPTRMKVIEKGVKELVSKINSHCSCCGMPGFTVTSIKDGLPCGLCGYPTNTTLSHTYSCNHCKEEKEVLFPYGKKTEDPMYCDCCNP